MKNIIATIAVVLATTFAANAQEKKQIQVAEVGVAENQQEIDAKRQTLKKEIYDIATFLNMKDEQAAMFCELMMDKAKIMSDETISNDRKNIIINQFSEKTKHFFDEKQIAKLKANKTMYESLFGAIKEKKETK